MQPYFHWINEPAEWRRDSDGLTVVTNKHTDFWRHTWYGFERFSGHLYAAEVAGDFTLQAKICADFTTLYDQAGLKDKDSIDADSLPEPDVLAAEAMGELVQALGELDALMRELGASDEADAQRQLLEEAFGEVKA